MGFGCLFYHPQCKQPQVNNINIFREDVYEYMDFWIWVVYPEEDGMNDQTPHLQPISLSNQEYKHLIVKCLFITNVVGVLYVLVVHPENSGVNDQKDSHILI